MKNLQLLICSLLLVFIIPKCTSAQQGPDETAGEKIYFYGIEINDVLCGYAKFTSTPEEKDGMHILNQEGNFNIKVTLLGGGVDLLIKYHYLVDPETRAVLLQ